MADQLISLSKLFNAIDPLYGSKRVDSWRTRKAAIHLAIMQGDFLAEIIAGTKVIESRLTKVRIAPVGQIKRGDLILFKQVGKKLMAVGTVSRAQSGKLDAAAWDFIRAHAEEIGVDDEYLSFKSDALYYALVWMTNVHQIPYQDINKKDRRSWVIISDME